MASTVAIPATHNFSYSGGLSDWKPVCVADKMQSIVVLILRKIYRHALIVNRY